MNSTFSFEIRFFMKKDQSPKKVFGVFFPKFNLYIDLSRPEHIKKLKFESQNVKLFNQEPLHQFSSS